MKLKDNGDYNGVREVMRPLWKSVGECPETKGLHASVAAEVLLCAGILSGWIGSKEGIEKAQEIAKDLISESINFYQSIGDVKKAAAARAELAYCYWREGGFDEARIMFDESLQKLTALGNTRARALLRLAILEWSASRVSESLRILRENAPLFRKITNHAIKGNYHNQLAMVLRNLATAEKRGDYIQEAINEYREAEYEFRLAHNVIFRADVQNNLAVLLYKLSRYSEAHQYLDQARRLMRSIKDKVEVAQIDDTQAQILIAETKFTEAEFLSRHAVRVLEKSGRQCLLADALITHGISLARLGKREPAQFAFQRAVEVAHDVGALNKAGLAALSLIEELDELSREVLHAAFHCASEWLANAQSQDLIGRFTTAAEKVFAVLDRELTAEEATEELFNKPCDLQKEMLRYEGVLVKQALAKTNGRLTEAASQLTLSYQALAYIIEGRHKDLLKDRTPIRRRSPKK
ncbi:MAG TPA: tetratricopeptide repeat protein [Pyrinomonadaceae bacterium]|nr:tetratricopeptide repeat protein [Pyrinomonadaceae bacterium]